MRTHASRRSGFTLPEVLVTVAIVSVLAAIVVPTVTSQISKGDETQAQTTITNIRTGVTAFVSDTRKFPRRVSHLFNPITATDNDLFGNAYGTTTVTRWKGPYVSGALPLGDSLNMSLSAFIADSLVDANGFVTASLMGLTTQALAGRLDTLIDAANGDAAGILRWTPSSGAITSGDVKLRLMGSK